MSEDKTKTDRYQISTDELESRMQKKAKEHDTPCQQAVAILEAALEMVMKKLGVDVEGDIPAQQEALGIVITEETRNEMAGLQGFFIFVQKDGDLVPHSWVGAARLNHLGECLCDVQFFLEERLEEVGGIKLIQ